MRTGAVPRGGQRAGAARSASATGRRRTSSGSWWPGRGHRRRRPRSGRPRRAPRPRRPATGSPPSAGATHQRTRATPGARVHSTTESDGRVEAGDAVVERRLDGRVAGTGASWVARGQAPWVPAGRLRVRMPSDGAGPVRTTGRVPGRMTAMPSATMPAYRIVEWERAARGWSRRPCPSRARARCWWPWPPTGCATPTSRWPRSPPRSATCSAGGCRSRWATRSPGTSPASAPGVTGLAEGDAVALVSPASCGECPACRRGHDSVCPQRPGRPGLRARRRPRARTSWPRRPGDRAARRARPRRRRPAHRRGRHQPPRRRPRGAPAGRRVTAVVSASVGWGRSPSSCCGR